MRLRKEQPDKGHDLSRATRNRHLWVTRKHHRRVESVGLEKDGKLDTYLLLVQTRYRKWTGVYRENRRTLKEIGSPIATMCTSNPRIRS